MKTNHHAGTLRPTTVTRRPKKPSRLRLAAALLGVGVPIAACATAGTNSSFNSNSSSGGQSSGSSNGGTSGGSSGTTSGNFGSSSSGSGDGSGRPQRCDEAGKCSCFNIASIGHPGCTGCEAATGGGDTTTSFVDYLNAHSSATVDLYATKPTISAAFLANYDVLILQGLFDSCGTVGQVGGNNFWSFGSDEIGALKTWVENGGGIITLTGFVADSNEVNPMNAILSAVTNNELSYGTADICNQTGVYCQGESTSLGGWTNNAIGMSVNDVGCFHGRPVNVSGSGATVDNHDVDFPSDVACAHTQVGKGHVVVYEDEWITYTSQWPGGSAGPNCEKGCIADAEPGAVYQVPQFWQNIINYAASATMCPMFTITVLQ
jgi:hypothetical protein